MFRRFSNSCVCRLLFVLYDVRQVWHMPLEIPLLFYLSMGKKLLITTAVKIKYSSSEVKVKLSLCFN